jgi:vancomycin resistance protein YoaR
MSERSTLTESHPLAEEPQRNEWLGILLRTLLAVAVLGAAYWGVAQYLGSRIPQGTTVEGVDIGNLTPEVAAETLESRLTLLAEDPVTVEADGETLRLDPAEAGLSLDYEATVGRLAGVSYDPRVLWDRITNDGRELELVAPVDTAALEAALAEHAADFDTEPGEGSVWLSLGAVHVADPQAGRNLDVPGTAREVAEAWPLDRTVVGSVEEVPTDLSAAEIERFVTQEAEPAVRASVVVISGKEKTVLTANQLSRLLTVVQTPEHTLGLELDEAGLIETVRGGLTEAVTPARDATVRLGDGGRPQIVPAAKGTELDDADIVTQVRKALQPGADRTVAVKTVPVAPEITNAAAEKWRVGEVMAEFRSEFPTGAANADRTENIRVGLSHLNGTVVMPGEQFSLAGALSPISRDRGYVEAGVIVDGRLVKGIGGGLSQVSTTVLNTAWFSGVQLDEFTPHSYYISRYPVGREATIAVGVIDNKWTNDTSSPVVVQTWISGDEIVMRFWGDRQYTVETVTGARRNVVQPKESTDNSPTCLPQSPQEGFDITVTRILKQGGGVVSERSYTTHYKPSDKVTCTHPAAGG